MKKNIILILFLVLTASIVGYQIYTHIFGISLDIYKESVVSIGNAKVTVDVVSTQQDREKGLSGKNVLEKDQGMLFVFSTRDRHGFWMKEMKFPIDMIWIDTDRVVFIKENAPVPNPSETLPIYVPQQVANLVLEVPAGYTREHNITVGSKVEVKNK